MFDVANVRLRYEPLPTSSPISQDAVVADLQKIFDPDETADKRVGAMEAGLIQWFKRQYGYIPILNKDDDGAKDALITDTFLDKHFEDMERRGV